MEKLKSWYYILPNLNLFVYEKFENIKVVFLLLAVWSTLDSASKYWYRFLPFACFPDRFAVLASNNLQILNINKSDEGIYRCEGRVEARGEIDFRDIIVIVNGKQRVICT